MKHTGLPYLIFESGDAAITVDFGNCIEESINREVIARFNQFVERPLPGMVEAVPAYSSLTIYYDVAALKNKISNHQTVFDRVRQQLEERLREPVLRGHATERHLDVPVCYDKEFAADIQDLAIANNILDEDVIRIHTANTYRVYMLGFLPGFPYMGEVDEKIAMPRKPQPAKVAAGSVGIAGKQTGIYPMASPGGWHIIGRTPLKLFKAPANCFNGEALIPENLDLPSNEPTLLKAGDTVSFYRINKEEFEKLDAAESQNY